MNFLIKTRIFENFSEITKCSNCNAVAYKGLLPQKRIQEGIHMKEWDCSNKNCNYHNTNQLSLLCKKCNGVRPNNSIPTDLIFDLFVPLN
jgi:hypothetical protein